jgi:hypothetical protein
MNTTIGTGSDNFRRYPQTRVEKRNNDPSCPQAKPGPAQNSKPKNDTRPRTQTPRRRAFEKRNPTETESRKREPAENENQPKTRTSRKREPAENENQPKTRTSPALPTGAIAGAAPKTSDYGLCLTDRT